MGNYDCILPWNHVRVWQTGKIWPCCQFQGSDVPDDLNLENGDFMNHPFMQDIRQRMLEDKPVKGCSRCYRLERETGTSMRKDVNTGIFGGIGDGKHFAPISADSESKLRFLELSLSNACNNSCRMCGPELSTHWYKDAKKMGMPIPKGIQYNPLNKTDLSELRYLKLLGGEPLLHEKEVNNILDRCNLQELSLMLITNTTVRPTPATIERFKKLKKLTITLSIDAYGTLNNFLRTGSDWEQVLENLHWFKDQGFAKITVHGVITIYNINCFMQLHEYCRDVVGVYNNFMVIEGPEYMRPRHLPQPVKQVLIDRYESFPQKTSFIKDAIYELKQPGNWNTFVQMDQLLNGVRNETFKTYNPELASLLIDNE